MRFFHVARYFMAGGVLLAAAGVIFLQARPCVRPGSPAAPVVAAPTVAAYLADALDAEGKGRGSEAISAYEHALALDPGLSFAYLKLGVIYFRMNLPSKAEASYLKAIEHGESDPDVYLYLGYVKESQDKLDAAQEYYAKAELAGSGNPVLYFNMGNVQARQGHNDKAVEYFKRAVTLKEDYTDAFVNLSIVLASVGEFADALYYLNKAEKLGYQVPERFRKDLEDKVKLNKV